LDSPSIIKPDGEEPRSWLCSTYHKYGWNIPQHKSSAIAKRPITDASGGPRYRMSWKITGSGFAGYKWEGDYTFGEGKYLWQGT
jgi:hypothetical protein